MDRSSGLIGGGITLFSKEPYVTLSHHTTPSRNQDLPFPLTNGSSNQPVLPPPRKTRERDSNSKSPLPLAYKECYGECHFVRFGPNRLIRSVPKARSL
ncbi:hypothetical protein ACOSQ4_013345 [Xanthoceras sorbifolium]